MTKGRISKWVFQENKARQIFRKTNNSYPLIGTRTAAYQGVRNVRSLFLAWFLDLTRAKSFIHVLNHSSGSEANFS